VCVCVCVCVPRDPSDARGRGGILLAKVPPGIYIYIICLYFVNIVWAGGLCLVGLRGSPGRVRESASMRLCYLRLCLSVCVCLLACDRVYSDDTPPLIHSRRSYS